MLKNQTERQEQSVKRIRKTGHHARGSNLHHDEIMHNFTIMLILTDYPGILDMEI